MTKDDIIKLAREAGLPMVWISDSGVLNWTDLEAFAALVAAAEREACETAVEDIARQYQKAHHPSAENVADACAYAIRARGENT
jgi:DNA polymerase III alpha subunit